MIKTEQIIISPELQQSIDQINTLNGSWQTLNHLTPDQLKTLRHVATIESIGSSTRIDGAKLTDREVEKLLSGLSAQSFKSRDEKEIPVSLPPLAADILQLVQDKKRITMADIAQVTNAPRSTIKKHISMLMDQKYLIRHGKGRAIWYTQT